MSETPQPAFEAPSPEMRYGETLDVAAANYDNGRTETGFITHVPEKFLAHKEDTEVNKRPKDQLADELKLVSHYESTPMGKVLGNSLDEMKRFAGIGIPKYSLPDSSRELLQDSNRPAEFTNDIGSGYVEFGSVNSPNSFALMQLRPAIKDDQLPSREAYNNMDPAQQYNASKGKYGELIAGEELPLESRRLLDDLYELMDAELVRDDGPNLRVYKGTYMGATIYISEHRSTFKHYAGDRQTYNVFSAHMLGEISGKEEVEGFSSDELMRITAAGHDWKELIKLGVNHSNLEGYLANIAELEEVADLGEIDRKVETAMGIRDMQLDVLREAGVELITTDGVDHTAEIAGVVAESYLNFIDYDRERKARYDRRGKVGKFLLDLWNDARLGMIPGISTIRRKRRSK